MRLLCWLGENGDKLENLRGVALRKYDQQQFRNHEHAEVGQVATAHTNQATPTVNIRSRMAFVVPPGNCKYLPTSLGSDLKIEYEQQLGHGQLE